MSTSLGRGAPVIAIDIGGTNTKAARIDSAGQVHDVIRVPTPAPGRDIEARITRTVVQLTTQLVDLASDSAKPAAVGVVFPGIVDEEAGLAVKSQNLGWNNVHFQPRFSEAIGLPVGISHDVRAAGRAEHALGAARGYDSALVVVIGTGIAATVITGGSVLVAGGYAGEIGHSVVDPSGPRCGCGNRGCLEVISSARAIALAYFGAGDAGVERGRQPGAREVLAALKQGDRRAAEVWQRATDALALGLQQAISLLAPEVVILGGGLTQAGPALFDPVRARLEELSRLRPPPPILPAAIGHDAGLVGAGIVARDQLADAPQAQVGRTP